MNVLTFEHLFESQTFKGEIMFASDLFLINARPMCNLERWGKISGLRRSQV